MVFWADAKIEPKRSHRWLLYLGDGAGGKLETYVCTKVDKPKVEVKETAHNYLSHVFKYPGVVTWQDVAVELVDPLDPDTSKTLVQILQNSGYVTPDTPLDLTSVSKGRAVSSMGDIVQIEQLGPDNDVIEMWELFNPWLKKAEFGTLEYKSEDLVKVSLTIAYDFAKISGKGKTKASRASISGEVTF